MIWGFLFDFIKISNFNFLKNFNLRDGETYYVFITAGNNLPYYPPYLMEDNEVNLFFFRND